MEVCKKAKISRHCGLCFIFLTLTITGLWTPIFVGCRVGASPHKFLCLVLLMWLTLPFFGAGYLWCLYWVISIWQDGIEEEDMVRMTERLKSLE